MECKFGFLCDYAQDSAGKLHAIGIGWDTLYARGFPTVHPMMCFVAVLRGTIAERGTKKVVLRLLDADGNDVLPEQEQQIPFAVRPPNVEGNVNIILQLGGLKFAKPGQYAFSLLVQDNHVLTIPFSVLEPPITATA